MGKRIIPLAREIVDYEGKAVKDGEKGLTLKKVLLTYVFSSNDLGLSQDDQHVIHILGFLFGSENGDVTVTTEQYDALKRMVDTMGKLQRSGGQLYVNLVAFQAKDLVDEAEIIQEEKSK